MTMAVKESKLPIKKKPKAKAKRKPRAKVTKPKEQVVPEIPEESKMPADTKEGMNIKAERENLYKSWKRLVTIANTLLTQAEADPLSVKAAMMAQIVRVLSQSGKILDDYEKHLRKVEEEPVIDEETGEEVNTPEEEAMMAEWNRREALTEEERRAEDMAEHARLMANPPKRDDSESTDDGLTHGLNFKRG
jgi:hypothetical protein